MKSWIVDADIKSDSKLAATIESLRPSLEESLTPRFAARGSARWSRAPGGVNLWLADEAYPVGVETFMPDEELTPDRNANPLIWRAVGDIMGLTSRAILDGIWAELETVDG